MEPYKDKTANSGVLAYEIGNDFIKVQFKNTNMIYLYNHDKPGKVYTEKMKKIAVKGKGLSAFISQKVKDNYACKFKIELGSDS